MTIDDIKPEQVWKLTNFSRPNVVVHNVDKYSEIVYWHYENERTISESKSDYFLKNFSLVK